ncbi:hypothetical protein BH11ARM2_BH11ARM2_24950 [soil metagenome]
MNFIGSRPFTRVIPRYFVDDESYALLQSDLSAHPEAGNIMPGTGHFRKLRWIDPQRGKGKRGGIRIV